ncbi:MAG: hypothetical protein ABSD50_01360 [Smithella sp.]|jgi:hypothetical protein
MNNELIQWKDSIIKVIRELQIEYSLTKGLFLTEGDLECHLYKRLTDNPSFDKYKKTKSNDWNTGFVHSQITWFKKENESGFRVDLTVLKPENIDINNYELSRDYPHKGYFHDGMVVAIELKFIRIADEPKIKRRAKEDYLKIIKYLKEAKEYLINNGRYHNVTTDEILFITLVVCKTKDIYEIAKKQLSDIICKVQCPDNIIPMVLYSDEIKIMSGSIK